MPDLSREIDRLIEYGQSVPGKLPSANYLRRIPDYFTGQKMVPPGGCKIPQSYCGISITGWIFSCWHNPTIGNIYKASLTDLLNSNEQQKFSELALQGKCQGCLTSCYLELY